MAWRCACERERERIIARYHSEGEERGSESRWSYEKGLAGGEGDGSGIREGAYIVGRTGAARRGASRRGWLGGREEGAHRGRSAREDIDIFGRGARIAAEVGGECALRVAAAAAAGTDGRGTGCARDGVVASPCRILQYPWLRRPRGFPAKDRKRDRHGEARGPSPARVARGRASQRATTRVAAAAAAAAAAVATTATTTATGVPSGAAPG